MSPNFDSLQSDYLSVKPNLRALATEETVLNLCNKDVMFNLSSEHIVQVHRMKEKSPGSSRAVRVTFASRKIRDAVYEQRRQLMNKTDARVYVSEYLTKAISDLFYEARKLVEGKRLNSCWRAGGLVYVKRLETDKSIQVRNTTTVTATS